MKVLVTGSSGLIGSEAVEYYDRGGHQVVGVDGISEERRIECSLHSLFGASKTAADVVAQEYSHYFGMKWGIFRGSCLTGLSHSGAELHGFLSYLVKIGS